MESKISSKAGVFFFVAHLDQTLWVQQTCEGLNVKIQRFWGTIFPWTFGVLVGISRW